MKIGVRCKVPGLRWMFVSRRVVNAYYQDFYRNRVTGADGKTVDLKVSCKPYLMLVKPNGVILQISDIENKDVKVWPGQ